MSNFSFEEPAKCFCVACKMCCLFLDHAFIQKKHVRVVYMYAHASEFATNNIERRAQQATKHTYGYILLYKSSVIFKTRTLRSPLSQSSYIKSLAFVIFNVTVKFRLSPLHVYSVSYTTMYTFYNLAFKSFKLIVRNNYENVLRRYEYV